MSSLRLIVLGCLFIISFKAGAELVGTAFTYQGELQYLGESAEGSFDFEFLLYDLETDGIALAPPLQIEDVAVNLGVFTVELDFGIAPFTGDSLWLEIGVREGLSLDPYTLLTPRQALTATPYAIHALSVAPGSVMLESLAPECSLGDILVMGSSSWECCSPPLEEICDELDNDCDGSVDETFPELGLDCGEGQCVGGQTICAPEGDTTLCSTEPGGPFDQSSDEICDGLDNDCNGLADAIGGEVDVDADGVLSCSDCDDTDASNYPGNTEICDGRDNDCNINIDQSDVPVSVMCIKGANVLEIDCKGELGCVITSCDIDYYDDNGNHLDGCESTTP